ncbi:glycosyltransferase family 2 protein [Robiginitomaculum antarcticum]|uniref:glycosyltransferase family 2 protein n=1 Tax=Robiginitomaculum antarcticum TaxID=437507 RepID=UPI001F298184|nr:glycosyltransferase family 2 protein [Robiginitomaculum antarcticum]
MSHELRKKKLRADDSGLMTLKCRTRDKVYLTTSNITLRFNALPTLELLLEKAGTFSTVCIRTDLAKSNTVRLGLYVLLYSETRRIDGMSYELKEGVTETHFEIPENAASFGLAVRASGKGTFQFNTLSLTFTKRALADFKMPVATTFLDSSILAFHSSPELETKLEFQTLLDSEDPFIRDAAQYCLSENPALANNTYGALWFLLANNKEHAVMSILDAYGDLLGDRQHRLRLSGLTSLLKMQSAVDYFENLPSKFKDSAHEVKFYIRALISTQQTAKLKIAVQDLLSQPKPHTGLINTFAENAERLSDNELKIIVQILLNKNNSALDYSTVIYFYDLLHSRQMTATAQSLASLMEERRDKSSAGDIINRHLLYANLAFRNRNYDLQEKYINAAFECSGLLPVTRIDTKKPFAADNIFASQNDSYVAKTVEGGPLVTVIVTSHNCETALANCAASILNQTYRHIELIIIDGASTDKTPNIIRNIAKSDSRVHTIFLKKNSGKFVSRNHGIGLAKGQYIICQNPKDWAHPEKVHRIVSEFQCNEDAVAIEAGHINISGSEGAQARPGGYLQKDVLSPAYNHEELSESIGFYDPVPTGADAEFRSRVVRLYGKDSINSLNALLTVNDLRNETGGITSSQKQYFQRFQEAHEIEFFERGKPALYLPKQLILRDIKAPKSPSKGKTI